MEKAREILDRAVENAQLSKPLLQVLSQPYADTSIMHIVPSTSVLHVCLSNCLTGSVTNMLLLLYLVQALIFFESFQSLPKRIDYLDSLVDKFVVGNPDSSTITSIADREDVSSIFLEVIGLHLFLFNLFLK